MKPYLLPCFTKFIYINFKDLPSYICYILSHKKSKFNSLKLFYSQKKIIWQPKGTLVIIYFSRVLFRGGIK